MSAEPTYLRPFTLGKRNGEIEAFRNDFPVVKTDGVIGNVKVLTVVPQRETFLRQFFGTEVVVLGYFINKGWWVLTPNREGKVFKVYFPCWTRRSYLSPLGKIWNLYAPKASFISKIADSCGVERPLRDEKGRLFFLVRGNEGYVPVRHGTDPDPGLKNWIGTASRVRIVYDAARIRHPAIEGLDYAQHGFIQQGKVWWPIQNGPFSRTYKRVAVPYYDDYDRENFQNKKVDMSILAPAARIALGVGLHALAIGASGAVIARAAAVELANGANPNFNLRLFAAENLPNILRGANEGIQPANALGNQQLQKQERERVFQKTRFELQFEVLEILKFQDSLDLGQEVVNALLQRDEERIERILRENPDCLLPEHRGCAVIQACIAKNSRVLGVLLSGGAISESDWGGALIVSTEMQDFNCVQTLTRREAYIAPEHLGLSVIMGARKGSIPVMRDLLKRNPNSVERGKAVVEACKHPNPLPLVELLLEGNAEIFDEQRGEALVIAAQKEAADLLRRLLANYHMTEEQRGKATIEAVRFRRRENARILRGTGPIRFEDRVLAERILLERRMHQQQVEEAGVDLDGDWA